MNKKLLPYILPIITIVAIAIYAFTNPSITGFAVANTKDLVNADIKLDLGSDVVMPLDTVITVHLDSESKSMKINDFITKTGQNIEIKKGINPDINYEGQGYSCDCTLYLTLEEFGLGEVETKEQHNLKVVTIHNNQIISESSTIIK